jgi:TfoX/Sxy family transcriptional regulator of competence genes
MGAMASNKEYLDFILGQLSEVDGVSYRPMMGEYLLYVQGKLIGGIYDDRFLVKPTKSALEFLPEAEKESPYEGAKEMLLVDNLDNKQLLQDLLQTMAKELSPAKKKR